MRAKYLAGKSRGLDGANLRVEAAKEGEVVRVVDWDLFIHGGEECLDASRHVLEEQCQLPGSLVYPGGLLSSRGVLVEGSPDEEIISIAKQSRWGRWGFVG